MDTNKKTRSFRPLKIILASLVLICLIGCIILVGYLADCYWGTFGGEPLPSWDEESLMAANCTFIYDSEDNLLAKIGNENRTNISISVLPKPAAQAFIASEDIRFYDHFGVDIRGILRALVVDFTTGETTQGGSTITQQLVRSCLLNSEKELRRKVQEAILAIQVERYYTKDEILEMYLNKIYFGEGAYGIESASKTYFSKSASELSIPEAALLASIIPAPSIYSPLNDYDGALQRRNVVLNQMADYGFITVAEAEQYKSQDLNLATSDISITYNHPYYVDYVLEQLIAIYGNDEVYSQGLTVYTTLSPKVQEACEEVIARDSNFPGGANGPEGAIVVMNPKNGQVLGLVGGRKHTSILGWNRATSEPGRQAGSSFKPIIAYAPAIEIANLSPASMIDGSPVNYNGYNPAGSYDGYLTMRRALTKSINTVAVRLLQEYVGIEEAIGFASHLGFKIDAASVGPSLALGTEEVTPLQMAAAYCAFANQGLYTKPTVFTRVISRSGKTDNYEEKPQQAMAATTAYMMASMMQDVVTSKEGTGNKAQISGWQVAGKTGTTDSGKDIWFVGYTPTLVCSVWMGYDNPTAMNTSYGGTYCAPVFQQVVSQILAGETPVEFTEPAGIVRGYVNGTYDMYLEGKAPKAHYNTHTNNNNYHNNYNNDNEENNDEEPTDNNNLEAVDPENGMIHTTETPGPSETTETPAEAPAETTPAPTPAETPAAPSSPPAGEITPPEDTGGMIVPAE